MAKVLTSTFLSLNPNRYFNLIKALSWLEVDLKMLLIWWLKFILSSIAIPKRLTFGTTLIFFWLMFIIGLVWFSLCLSKIIAWNLPGLTIMWLLLKQFIAIGLFDSRILIRFSIVLSKLDRVLTPAKLWAEATNIK